MENVSVSEVALSVMRKRVLFKKPDGEQETPLDAYKRVANFVAGGHAAFDLAGADKFKDKIVGMLSEGKFMPNTPTLVNAGFPKAQCSACFVIPMDDNLPSIYETHTNQGLIQASGGGIGTYIGNIRSNGTLAAGRFGTKGPISWLRMMNENATHVVQGMREGANMAVLDVGHPDIMDFIKCKRAGHKIDPDAMSKQMEISPEEAKRIKSIVGIEKFNISVSITDRFMKALEGNEDWYFIDPHTKQRAGSIKAKLLWDTLIENAWENGEPGIIFIDTVNKHNTAKAVGLFQSCNPCGEQYRRPYESCNLGHVNLSKYVIGINGSSNFNWKGFEDAIRFGVQFLDDIVEINQFPVPQLAESNKAMRNIGLGLMGWADTLALMNIPYDSDAAVTKIDQIGSFFKETAENESERLGCERGNFPMFDVSDFPNMGIKNRRNADITTIAPTGQTSMYAGCSSGIEPILFPVMQRKQADMVQIDYHPALFKVLDQRGLNTPEVKEKLGKLGSVRKADFLPEDIRLSFPSAHDVSYEWHVKHQAAWQRYISSGVSKTINFHNSATREDIDKAMRMAYAGGCKGITVYRDGSRSGQPISSMKDQLKIRTNKRDDVTHGTNRKIKTSCGNIMSFVGGSKEGEVQELTIRMGKSGGCLSSFSEGLARIISIALQHGVAPDKIIKQLSGIRCHLPAIYRSKHTGEKPRIITSCCDAVSVAIEEHLIDGSEKKLSSLDNSVHHAGACPECGGGLIFTEGCAKCVSGCGFARCS